jgi:hypothetical protein
MEYLFLFFVVVGGFLGLLLIVHAAWSFIDRLGTPPPPRSLSDPGRVGLYTGCITCEGADAVSMAELIRHQVRDHGAIAWQ